MDFGNLNEKTTIEEYYGKKTTKIGWTWQLKTVANFSE